MASRDRASTFTELFEGYMEWLMVRGLLARMSGPDAPSRRQVVDAYVERCPDLGPEDLDTVTATVEHEQSIDFSLWLEVQGHLMAPSPYDTRSHDDLVGTYLIERREQAQLVTVKVD